jgi:predicted transcriptional regulator
LPDSFILKFPVASGHAGLCGKLPARSVSRSTTPDWTAPRFSDLISSTTLLRTTGQISHISPQSVAAQPFHRLSIATLLLIATRHTKQKGEASMSETSSAFVGLSADVVAAYVSNNSATQADLPSLIASVHTALRDAANGTKEAEKVVLEPPVSIKKSITANHLISMEDGRPYKSLKRHLTARGLTPAQYREKWSLPLDYPMVAPNYSKARSELAKAIGLGQTRKGKKAGKKRAP